MTASHRLVVDHTAPLQALTHVLRLRMGVRERARIVEELGRELRATPVRDEP